MSLTVTVVDNETGDTETQHVPDHEVLVITTGDCYIASVVAHLNGTQVYTIKGQRASSRTSMPPAP